MKILHLCLSCFYIDNAGYQENQLVRKHIALGHDVLVIASTENIDNSGRIIYVPPGKYFGTDDATVIRIPYVHWLPHFVARKLRMHSNLFTLIDKYAPDVILFHGCCGAEIATTTRYIINHPKVLFYVDCHEDFNNSAKNFVSMHILHGVFYRFWLFKALPYVKKILCVNTEAIQFMSEFYRVPACLLEFYPLGGNVLLVDDMNAKRNITRKKHDILSSDYVFIQTGKMNPRKKLSHSLSSFSKLPDHNIHFWIVGLLDHDVDLYSLSIIDSDPRIKFFGWRSVEELTDLFCAADMYLQPGTQSASMQHALCCGLPGLLADVPSHQFYLDSGSILINTPESLFAAMASSIDNRTAEMRITALGFALKYLDYSSLADRILHT